MKKLFTMMAMLLTAHAAMAIATMGNVWAEVEAYPTGAGKVYLTSNDAKPTLESGWGDVSESRFTITNSGEKTYYKVENGDFVPFTIPSYYGIVEVDGGDDYECVGLVKQIREDGNYTDEDYYQGGPAVHDKSADAYKSDTQGNGNSEYLGNITLIKEDGIAVDLNSGRDGKKYQAQVVIPDEENEKAHHEMTEEEYYWFIHDNTIEKGTWPEAPTKLYALFKEKVGVTMADDGQMIFSSTENLKLQKDSGLQAYVVYKVVDGIGQLKATDSIPANIGVVLKGEPGREYKFDRIPEPKRLTIMKNGVVKTYNALLCEIYGFYPENEILYRFGNYDYGAGFYKVQAGQQPDGDYLTMAIPGGTPPEFFTIDGFTTGVQHVQTSNASDTNALYDLQGRRLTSVPAKGVYIQNGRKVMK